MCPILAEHDRHVDYTKLHRPSPKLRRTGLADHHDLHVAVLPLRPDLWHAAEGATHIAHIRGGVAVAVYPPRVEVWTATAAIAALLGAAAHIAKISLL